MLVASSPIEIEAKMDEAGLPSAARDAALQLFHHLTDRIGQAVIELAIAYEDWPKHRMYFAEPADLQQLLAGLKARADILDVSGDAPKSTPDPSSKISGIYARGEDGSFGAVMVAHEDHTLYHS